MQQLTSEIIEAGYFEKGGELVCLFCGASYLKEEIFAEDSRFFTSRYQMQQHISKVHGGVLKAVLNLPQEATGISATQKNILSLFAVDLTDEEIAQQLTVSTSTIRNHRFKLKEKKRQAQYFLAVMAQLERSNKKMQAEEISIANYDDRFNISEKERQKVLQNFLDEKGWAETIPSKEKSKIILLQKLIGEFNEEKTYTEAQVNQIIQQMFADFVSVRRYLIQYGFLGRTKDGQKYWRI